MIFDPTDAVIRRTQKAIGDVDRTFAQSFSDARTGNFLTVILQVRANVKFNAVPSAKDFQRVRIAGATIPEAIIFTDIYGGERREVLQ